MERVYGYTQAESMDGKGNDTQEDLSILRLMPPSNSLVNRAAVSVPSENGSVSTMS